MKILVIGGGIGGLATALSLHRVGIEVDIYEQAQELRELGVGINVLPHAIQELATLGLLRALDEAGIRTCELIYASRHGKVVWREPRGIDAGYAVPQISIHRGKLLGVLLRAVLDRIGASRLHADHRLLKFAERNGRVIALFESRSGKRSEGVGDGLIGADGIHSRVRSIFYPGEGPPRWSGMMLWRGATSWPLHEDGRTMVIAGGNAAKFVFYPIHFDPSQPGVRLTNWAVMAHLGNDGERPPHREDWNRLGRVQEVLGFVQDHFRLGFVEPAEIIKATGSFFEYPNCDRDPVRRWSFGRATLLGDAAHAMYPVGSNGASQAILDAVSVARYLTSGAVEEAFAAYDSERRPATTEIVRTNRRGGPEGVIDLVEARAPEGFDDVEAVAIVPNVRRSCAAMRQWPATATSRSTVWSEEQCLFDQHPETEIFRNAMQRQPLHPVTTQLNPGHCFGERGSYVGTVGVPSDRGSGKLWRSLMMTRSKTLA